jgi:hypothetical protein
MWKAFLQFVLCQSQTAVEIFLNQQTLYLAKGIYNDDFISKLCV